MQLNSEHFKELSKTALQDPNLQIALKLLKEGLIEKRSRALKHFPDYEKVQQAAIDIKNHTLQYLDYYLMQFEANAKKNGANIHFAEDAQDATSIVVQICKSVHAKLITKSKSMVAEEINLNDELKDAGFKVVETDLGEYIIQLRNEKPSHIVLPAVHVLKEEIANDFLKHHKRDPNRSLTEIASLLNEARDELREQFLNADVGITGANCLVAETGSVMMVTNEGNGELTQTCAKVHIVIASIEKVVPRMIDAFNIMRLLPRAATGQAITSYVTFTQGKKRDDQEWHIILLDHHRSQMLGSEFEAMLRCIRCGACLNHCPVYDAVGGKPYGTYPGPMGAVLMPSLFGIRKTEQLPNASTFCGRCEEVCPMKIPLPAMMRNYRDIAFKKHLSLQRTRLSLQVWHFFATHPKLYHYFANIAAIFLTMISRKKGRLTFFPFATAWTKYHDLPMPSGKTFHALWRQENKDNHEKKFT